VIIDGSRISKRPFDRLGAKVWLKISD
jgi:hypothetical protein